MIGEHDTRLWRVLEHYVLEARSNEDFSEVKSVGVDETSRAKGHNYVSVFIDLDKSKGMCLAPRNILLLNPDPFQP
jgi:transposase